MILFESFSEIENILNWYNITNYTIDNDGLVNVDNDVDLYGQGLAKIPVKFGRVTGNFDCGVNNLTSLLGSPKEVGGFYCDINQLTSLLGAPQRVVGDFYCRNNKLTSLSGSPERVGGDFNCGYNKIISFEGLPKHIGGEFRCAYNPISKIWSLFRDYSKIELLNDYDAIQDGVVILDRLNDFLATIGKETVDSIELGMHLKCI